MNVGLTELTADASNAVGNANHQPQLHSDMWSDWLLHGRHADDPEFDRALRADLKRAADRVLDGARLEPGMALADVGAGDGLIFFRAIDRIGPTLHVLLTDLSGPMLRHAATLAIQRDVHCTADEFKGIHAASVDAVTTRAVLAYVANKSAALREFYRVLKPGGRISIAEPILRDEALAACALKGAVDARTPGDQDRFLPLIHRWKAAQYPDTAEKIANSPITNYTERDLVDLARASGFTDIHLEFRIDESPSIVTSWSAYIGSSLHPWAPALSVILAEQLTLEERQFFEPLLRSMVEASKFGGISRIAYLTAEKPRI